MPTAQLLVTETDPASSSATAIALPGLGETAITFASSGLWDQIATDGAGNYAATKSADSILAFSNDDGVTWTEDTTSVSFVVGLMWDNKRRRFVALATAASGPASGKWALWYTTNGTWTQSADSQSFTGLLHQSPSNRILQNGDVYMSIETAAGAFGEIDVERYYEAIDPDQAFSGFLFSGPFSLTGGGFPARINSRFRNKEIFPRYMNADNADPITPVWVLCGGAEIYRNGAKATVAAGGADEYHLAIPDGAGNWLAVGYTAAGWGYALSSDTGSNWTGSQDLTAGYSAYEAMDGIWDGASYWVSARTVSGGDAGAIFEYDPGTDTWTKHDLPTGGVGDMALTGWPQPALFVAVMELAETTATALPFAQAYMHRANSTATALDMGQYTRADLDTANSTATALDMGPYTRADLDVANSTATARDMTLEISSVTLVPLNVQTLFGVNSIILPSPATGTEVFVLLIVTSPGNTVDYTQIGGDPTRRYLENYSENGNRRVIVRLYPLLAGDEIVTVKLTDASLSRESVAFPYLASNFARIPTDINNLQSFCSNTPGNPIHTGTWNADARGQMLAVAALTPQDVITPPLGYAVDQQLSITHWQYQTVQRGVFAGAQPDSVWLDGEVATGSPAYADLFWLVFYDIGTRIREGAAYRAAAGIFTERPGAAEPPPPAVQHPQRDHQLPPDPDPIQLPLPPWVPGTGPYRRSP